MIFKYFFWGGSQVGTITIDEEDTKGHSFHIQVLGRLYQLRADSKAACKDWVITLNRIKEAHLQQGNVKLVSSGHSHKNIRHHFAPVDLLDTQSNGDFGTPRVVVVSNRQRTRAVAESQDFDQLIRLKDGQGEEEDPAITSHLSAAYGGAEKRLSTVGAVVLTRWTKRKSSLSHLGSKLRTWALSMRHLSCAHSISAVHGLDRHVHPPGHDYTSSTLAARRPHNSAGNNIDNRESSSGDRGTGALGGGSDGAWIADETDSNDDDAVAAEPGSSAQHDERSRPRRMSSASEDIRVLS